MSINAQQLRKDVIRPTLEAIQLWSRAAEELMMGTAAHESHLGTYLKQIRGPAVSIYQIEPNTYEDIVYRYLDTKCSLKNLVLKTCHLTYIPRIEELITNLKYATCIARIRYFMVSEKLPNENEIFALAQYWKKYYNTSKGHGSVAQWITDYKRYVVG